MAEVRHKTTGAILLDPGAATLAGMDLSGAKLLGADLNGRDLAGARLVETHLEGAELREADLRGAQLGSAYLPFADLRGAALAGAELSATNLYQAAAAGADLADASLPGANLQGANLQGANLQGARLQRANLESANLQGARLAGAVLDAAMLRCADLRGADLRGADLTGSRLHAADLTGANLAGARLRGILYDNSTRWPAGFDPGQYQRLDAGLHVAHAPTPAGDEPLAGVPVPVMEAMLADGPSGPEFSAARKAEGPTIPGVELGRMQTYLDERRLLVVSHHSNEPPGTLGYTVVVQPGYSVGNHFHFRREERIAVIHGSAEFRLLDQRPASETAGRYNRFRIDQPGVFVHVPPGVAHAIAAEDAALVLQVRGSCDYDPGDDVHLELPAPE